MAFGLRIWLPVAFAILCLAIPPVLFVLYPSSFWANTDYEPLGLADALNLAYRLADRQMYPARGLMDHPGVPFYFMSWLALAFATVRCGFGKSVLLLAFLLFSLGVVTFTAGAVLVAF